MSLHIGYHHICRNCCNERTRKKHPFVPGRRPEVCCACGNTHTIYLQLNILSTLYTDTKCLLESVPLGV